MCKFVLYQFTEICVKVKSCMVRLWCLSKQSVGSGIQISPLRSGLPVTNLSKAAFSDVFVIH